MTVTICNGKGGAGKTTLAVLLVLAWRRSGRAAALVDRDPQATGQRWMATLGESCGAAAESPDPIRVIDTPPLLSAPVLAESLREADLAILVSSSSPADLWTSQATVGLIRSHLRPEKPVRLLFNQVQRHTLLGRDLERLSRRIGLAALTHALSRRQTYQHAALLGWEALDRPSREELLALAGEIASFDSPSP